MTGASGFIGSALVRRLAADGTQPVLAAVRRADAYVAAGVRVVSVGELGAQTDWRSALKGVEVVVHCAARTHNGQDRASHALSTYRRVNVLGTQRLADQAAQAGVRRFVFLSSVKVNGETTAVGHPFRDDDAPAPRDAYGTSKLEAEQALRALADRTGIEVVVIRPPLVYGPGVKGNFAALLHWVRRGVPLPLGAVRDNRRSLLAVDNLVDLLVCCLTHPAAVGEVFLASDGEDLSTSGLIHRLAAAMGKPARLLTVPVWLLRGMAGALGGRSAAQRLLDSLQLDASKARMVLGWRPPVSVDEGLRRAALYSLKEPVRCA